MNLLGPPPGDPVQGDEENMLKGVCPIRTVLVRESRSKRKPSR